MDEKLNADTTGMRLAGVTGWSDAPAQLAARGQLLLEGFPDRGGWLDRHGWLYSLSLLNFFSLLDGLC